MNEKLQYATMLEIPVSTCNVTFQPTKKKRAKTKKQQNPDGLFCRGLPFFVRGLSYYRQYNKDEYIFTGNLIPM